MAVSNRWLTLLANILLAVGIVTFAAGFFPHKAVLPGLATWSAEAPYPLAQPPFNRVVFMVVDALRSDFIYSTSSHFTFTQKLIASGQAVPFTGHASPPTITMPKVKAITTGSVPSFVDLILSFDESDTSSSLSSQDSWLAQIKAQPGGKLVHYGDDTWLRLFPDFFDRADGTSSFFVSDFTEVDNNVTRHVPTELRNDDWSVMILHYLGLDHIGHKTGPQGPNMPAKQEEMDGIVEQVFTAMREQHHLKDCLLVLLGDHGMNEAGNHGASSAGETSTALTFISPKFANVVSGYKSPLPPKDDFHYYDEVEQSDIAVTLAALLGFPIPKNSLGIVMPRLLDMWFTDPKDKLAMLYANALQIQKIAAATFVDAFANIQLENCQQIFTMNDEQQLACDWQRLTRARQETNLGGLDTLAEIKLATQFLKRAQSLLSGAASQYDLTKMSAGIGFSVTSFVMSLLSIGRHLSSHGFAGIAFLFVLVVYGITMFASSYVEEEHQFWYWATAAWLTIITIKARRLKNLTSTAATAGNITVCILFGIARRWNQTGQKYAGDPDLVTEFLSTSPWCLWALIITTYAVISRRLSRRALKLESFQLAVSPAIVAISAFLFKLSFTAADAPELLQGIKLFDPVLNVIKAYPLVSLARLVYAGLAHLLASSFFYAKPWTTPQNRATFLESFHDIVSLMLVTQTRTVNVPLILLFYIQLILLKRYQALNHLELTLTSLLLQYSTFFMFGGTNAISSVDLSNAYNGISGFNVWLVAVLTFVGNWAGPIWWTSGVACVLVPAFTTLDAYADANASHPQTGKTSGGDSVDGSGSVDSNTKLRSQSQSQSSHHYYHYSTLTLFATGSTLAVMLACTILREHLFIWTVFSPKYLYTLAWTFGQHFLVNGVVGRFTLGH